MATPFENEHPELFHYTGIGGLTGILETQMLWASHACYLNDAMELKAFKEILPSILRPMVENFIAESVKVPANQSLIEQRGGSAKVIVELMTDIANGMYNALLGTSDIQAFRENYVLSFCSPENNYIAQHGLLSQWRGYGQDGGYAIVFDTARFDKLLEQEKDRWAYDLFGDKVLYSDDEIRRKLCEDLNTLSDCFSKYLMTGNQQFLEGVVYPLLKCACLYKHRGFYEEREVRVIASLPNKEVFETLKVKCPDAKEKERRHFVRRGTPVPCVHLFDGITERTTNPLPITRIIVGPHRDKDIRRHAVENLLKQYQLNIPVVMSEIPYVGGF